MSRVREAVVVGLLVLLPIAAEAGPLSHSGTVIAVDRNAGTIELGEIGPWRVVGGVTVVSRHTITVTRFTNFVRVRRAAEPRHGGYPGDFVEDLLAPWEIRPGDFVTVLCQHDGRFLTALEIAVTEPAAR